MAGVAVASSHGRTSSTIDGRSLCCPNPSASVLSSGPFFRVPLASWDLTFWVSSSSEGAVSWSTVGDLSGYVLLWGVAGALYPAMRSPLLGLCRVGRFHRGMLYQTQGGSVLVVTSGALSRSILRIGSGPAAGATSGPFSVRCLVCFAGRATLGCISSGHA